MKLEKFKAKNSKKKAMIIGSITLILLIAIIVVYRSFAFFESNQEFNVIKGSVPNQDYDVMLSLTKEDASGNKVAIDKIPEKSEEKQYEVNITCNNGSSGIWNYDEWKPEISNYTTTRTKCSIHFKENNEYVYPASGKKLIADAITNRGIETSLDDSFEQMAEKINNINNNKIELLSTAAPGSTITFKENYSYVIVFVYNMYNQPNLRNEKYVDFDINLTSSNATIDYQTKTNYPWYSDAKLYASVNYIGMRNITKGDTLKITGNALYASGQILTIK